MSEIEPEEDRRKILRVVEVDSQRLSAMDSEILKLRLDADVQGKTLDRVEVSVGKLDEAIRGNGKEGLNQTVGLMREKLDELIDKMQDTSDFALRMNAGKFRAIVREEIEKDKIAPGGWMEFRTKWLFPIILGIIMSVVGAYVGSHYLP